MPPCDYYTTVDRQPTIPYFNAGVLIFSKAAQQNLIPTWIKLTRQLIGNLELLGSESNFCEQASLTLALAASDAEFATLGNEMNFPMHFDVPTDTSLTTTDPAIIHYHCLTDDEGYLLESPYPSVNRRILRFNARLKQVTQ
jgi:hypothetical protein